MRINEAAFCVEFEKTEVKSKKERAKLQDSFQSVDQRVALSWIREK